jgi:hypothetical protein
LLELFPDIKKVYIPIEEGYAPAEIGLEAIRPLAQKANVELVVERFTEPEQVQPAIAAIPDDVDAIFTMPDIFVSGDLLPQWSAEAIKRGIPHSHITRAGEGPYTRSKAGCHLSGHSRQTLQWFRDAGNAAPA